MLHLSEQDRLPCSRLHPMSSVLFFRFCSVTTRRLLGSLGTVLSNLFPPSSCLTEEGHGFLPSGIQGLATRHLRSHTLLSLVSGASRLFHLPGLDPAFASPLATWLTEMTCGPRAASRHLPILVLLQRVNLASCPLVGRPIPRQSLNRNPGEGTNWFADLSTLHSSSSNAGDGQFANQSSHHALLTGVTVALTDENRNWALLNNLVQTGLWTLSFFPAQGGPLFRLSWLWCRSVPQISRPYYLFPLVSVVPVLLGCALRFAENVMPCTFLFLFVSTLLACLCEPISLVSLRE